jgi:hypothetical protein
MYMGQTPTIVTCAVQVSDSHCSVATGEWNTQKYLWLHTELPLYTVVQATGWLLSYSVISRRSLDALLTVHRGTLMNQHQLDTLFLVCLLRFSASTCFGRYWPIFRRLCTVAVWCNCVRRMCVDCVQFAVGTANLPQPIDIRTHYTKCRLCSASWGWASNARNIYRPLILNKLNEKCITLVSVYCSMAT